MKHPVKIRSTTISRLMGEPSPLDVGTSMKGRGDPALRMPAEEKEACLKAFVDWIDPAWLGGIAEHHVRTVFHRADWVATAEMLVVGYALRRVIPRMTSKLLRRLRADVQGDDRGKRAGALFEIIAGSMFDDPAHRVTMAANDQPGFDLEVALPNANRLRVSCKALCPSDEEVTFRGFAEGVEYPLQSLLPNGTETLVALFRTIEEVEDAYNRDRVVGLIHAALQKWDRTKPGEFSGAGWAVGLNVAVKRAASVPLFDGAPTYQLLAARPHAGNEQRRFERKVRDGFANLKDHCPVEQGTANVVFIKVPSSVWMATADRYVAGIFDASTAHVSAVYVYRTQVCGNDGNTEGWIGHEMKEHKNPFATVKLEDVVPAGFAFKLDVGVGKTQEVEPVLIMEGDGPEDRTEIRESYAFSRGHQHYYMAKRNERGEPQIHFSHPPGVDVTCWFHQNGRLGSFMRLGAETSLALI